MSKKIAKTKKNTTVLDKEDADVITEAVHNALLNTSLIDEWLPDEIWALTQAMVTNLTGQKPKELDLAVVVELTIPVKGAYTIDGAIRRFSDGDLIPHLQENYEATLKKVIDRRTGRTERL